MKVDIEFADKTAYRFHTAWIKASLRVKRQQTRVRVLSDKRRTCLRCQLNVVKSGVSVRVTAQEFSKKSFKMFFGLYWAEIEVIQGIYRDTGKEHGSCYSYILGFRRHPREFGGLSACEARLLMFRAL